MAVDANIKQLIEHYQSILMAIAYSNQLENAIAEENERLEKIHQRIHELEDEINELAVYSDLKEAFTALFVVREYAPSPKQKQYYDLILEYNTGLEFIASTQFEIKVLADKIATIDQVRDKLRAAFVARKEKLKNWQEPQLKTISRLFEQLDKQLMLKAEQDEALAAGEKVMDTILQLINYLEGKQPNAYPNTTKTNTIYGFPVQEVEKVQQFSIKIRQLLLEYQSEIKDIYELGLLDFLMYINEDIPFVKDISKKIATNKILDSQINHTISNLQDINKRLLAKQTSFEEDRLRIEQKVVKLMLKIDNFFKHNSLGSK